MMSDRHFQGNGIRLRAPEPEDLEVMFRFENATDVWEMSNTTGPYSRFQLKQYIEQTQNDLFADRQLRLMIENGNRQVVGMVDVCSFDPLHNRAEVGIMVDKSCRRQGIGRNALALLEDTVSVIWEFISCLPISLWKTVPSRRLFAACGYKESAVLKEWAHTFGGG